MKAVTAFGIAAIAMGLSPPAFAKSGDLPKTIPALGCLLGMVPAECETAFTGAIPNNNVNHPLQPFAVSRLVTHCAGAYAHKITDNCLDGVLETVRYLGANADGADVYDVRYINARQTYIIAQPRPDGRIARLWIFDRAAGAVPQSLARVTSPAAQTLYIRQRQGN